MISNLASFAARLRELMAVSAIETTPNGSRESNSNAFALELFALQFTANAAYHAICTARGATPATVNHWTQIPAVPTTAFKEFEMTCLPPGQRMHVFHSSGTTGHQPSRHFHCAESLEVYEASLWPWFRAHVLEDGQWQMANSKSVVEQTVSAIGNWRLAILTPPPAQAPHSSLVHMFDVVRRNLSANDHAFVGRVEADGSWSLDLDAACERLTSNSRLQTSDFRLLLVGTAFSFVHLLDGLAERNLRVQLPPGSRVMETGGYKGRSRDLPKVQLHSFITERLGVPPSHIICEYGMSELSSQAYDLKCDEWRVTGDETPSRHPSPVTRHFYFPPWSRVQIISPETGLEVGKGETGLIRVFDLANVFSVLAVQTEDLAIRRGEGFELIGRAANVESRGCSLMAVNS